MSECPVCRGHEGHKLDCPHREGGGLRLTATEAPECKECLRLTRELVETHAAHGYALLKSKEAYGRGREQGAADVAVDIATWLETLALEHPQGTLLAELAERVLDAEYMEEEKEAPAHD